MTLQLTRYGPFPRGVVEGMNSVLETGGMLRYARNAYMDGVGRLLARPGTELAMTLYDNQGTPALITSVVALVPFGDGALAVGHSTVTDKFYLYRFNSDLSGWFNGAGALQSNLSAEPVGELWTSATDPEKVLIAEGLGEAFIAHTQAGTTFRTKRYSVSGGIGNLDADLRGSGVEQTFFRGLVSFQQHLWGWGYGSEAAGQNDRPELLRYGFPIFATVSGGYFAQADSFTVGHRVQSYRERVVGAVVAGEVLYVGTNFSLWPVTGFGRNSWDKSRPLDDSYGFAGPLAAVSANGVLYYWSHRGPLRVSGLSRPEPMWDPIPVAASGVVDPVNIVAVFDPDRDQVLFLYQNQTSGRVSVLGAVDTRRDTWLGPDGDIGVGIRCAGLVQPTSAAGPAGPPTNPSTSNVGGTVATANLTPGDVTAGCSTIWEYKRQVDSIWTVAAETASSQTAYQFTGLTSDEDYHWRAKHRKNGQDTAYLGPEAATEFTTSAVLASPTNCQITQISSSPCYVKIEWVNSGEMGVSTEVYFDMTNPPGTYKRTVGPGIASSIELASLGNGEYFGRVRHVKTGYTESGYSLDNVFVSC